MFLMLLNTMTAAVFALGNPQADDPYEESIPWTPSALAFSPAEKMDRAAIHEAYMQGHFPEAIGALEKRLATCPSLIRSPLTRSDSVFIHKHLGVMYAAAEATRGRGRQCFRRMLALDPEADLLEMFTTASVEAVFREAKAGMAADPQGDSTGVDVAADQPCKEKWVAAIKAASASPRPAPPKTEAKLGAGTYWVGGACLAAVAGGVGAFLLLDSPPSDNVRVIKVGE